MTSNTRLTKLRLLANRARKEKNLAVQKYDLAWSEYTTECKKNGICPNCRKEPLVNCECVILADVLKTDANPGIAFTDAFSGAGGVRVRLG